MGMEMIILGLLGGAAGLYFLNTQPGGIGGLLSGFGLGGGGAPAAPAAAAPADDLVPDDIAKGETPDPEPVPTSQYASIYPMLVPTFYPVQRIIYYVNLYRPRCPGIYWADDDILEALLDYRHDLDDLFSKHRRHIDIDDLARALSLRVYPYFCDPWRFRTIRLRKWHRWPHFHPDFHKPDFRRRWDDNHHNDRRPPWDHRPPHMPPTTPPPHTPPPTTPPPHTPPPTTPPGTPPPTTTPPPPGHPRPYKWGQDGNKGPRKGDMPGQSDAPTPPATTTATTPPPPVAVPLPPTPPVVTAPTPAAVTTPATDDDLDTNDGQDTGVPATTTAPAAVKPGDVVQKPAATPMSRPFKGSPKIKKARLGWSLDYV